MVDFLLLKEPCFFFHSGWSLWQKAARYGDKKLVKLCLSLLSFQLHSWTTQRTLSLLTLSAHAQEVYSRHFICQSVILSFRSAAINKPFWPCDHTSECLIPHALLIFLKVLILTRRFGLTLLIYLKKWSFGHRILEFCLFI